MSMITVVVVFLILWIIFLLFCIGVAIYTIVDAVIDRVRAKREKSNRIGIAIGKYDEEVNLKNSTFLVGKGSIEETFLVGKGGTKE